MQLPTIIQGGMGVGISGWRLAKAVASQGQLGVVSGTALDQMLVRRLQDGDPGGELRRALAHFPIPYIREKLLAQWYRPAGLAPNTGYRPLPLATLEGPKALWEIGIAANFVEVFLAKEGHAGTVGVNYLEKIQLPLLPALYGALLARVDFVLVGAGIPLKVPGAITKLIQHETASYPVALKENGSSEMACVTLNPLQFWDHVPAPLGRPRFLPIVSSHVLAATLQRKANGPVDGFVVESPRAGGHNAPPREKGHFDEQGQPQYGPRDEADLAKFRELGQPFWLAGGYGRPEQLEEALRAGAAGIQLGTAFALCEESGLNPDRKRSILEQLQRGTLQVLTDPLASPTGFPFKTLLLEGTLTDPDLYAARPRVCDLGYLREAYLQADGTVGFRCPAEPLASYVAKGGTPEDAAGRRCLCNALLSNIGLGQRRGAYGQELELITAGDDLATVQQLLRDKQDGYSAQHVLDFLLGRP